MLRALFAVGVIAACGSPRAPHPQVPISNTRSGPIGSCEVDWLAKTDELVVTERVSNQFGALELRAELRVSAGALAGVVQASFRRSPDARLRSMQFRVHLPRPAIADVLASMARAARVPEDPGGS